MCKACGKTPGEPTARARRGKGEGAAFHDCANGRWEAAFEGDRDPVTGRRQRIKVRARTKTEALKKLEQKRREYTNGATPGAGAITLGDFLDDWLKKVIPGRVESDNTIANYGAVVENHLKPALGSIRIDRLTPEHVDRMLAAKADAGLSRSYISRMRTVLADALRHAERRGIVTRNAGALSVMPKTTAPPERRSLTADEARRLLKAAEGDRLEAMIKVGVATGLRPGELTGLLWSDVALKAKPRPTLTVSGSLKRRPDSTLYRGAVKRASAGLRTVALPASAVAALKAHETAQKDERAKAGDQWQEHGLIFASEVGTPIDPANLRKGFAKIAKAAGLSGGFPYLLRHTTVSLLIDAGVGIEEVADLLGDDPRTLYRHYRHRVQPIAKAGLAMDRVLRS